MHIPPELGAHANVTVTHRRRPSPGAPVDRAGEHTGVCGQGNSQWRRVGLALRPIGAEERNRVCVEGDAPLLVGLGVLFPRRRVALRDAGPDRDDGPVQINPVPAQRAQFASPCAGSHGQPQEGPPPRFAERRVEDRRSLLGCRWVRLTPGTARRLGLFERIHGDPTPPHGATQRAAEAVVHLPDLRCRERLADVRPTASVHSCRLLTTCWTALRPSQWSRHWRRTA